MKELYICCHLNKIRQDQNFSQNALAYLVGISRNALSAIENGGDCKNSTAIALCSILNVSHEDIWEVKEYKSE